MAKPLAMVFIFCLAFLNMLGNFWYTYGIWPQSWLMFTLFFISHLIIYGIYDFLKKGSN